MNTESAYSHCMRNINFQESFDYLLDQNNIYCLFNIVINCENISYSNVKKFEEKLLSNNNISRSDKIYYSTELSSKVEIADIKAHQNYIIDNGSVIHIYNFAWHVKRSDKQLLSQIALESLDEYWINKFYDHIEFDKKNYDNYFRNLIFK